MNGVPVRPMALQPLLTVNPKRSLKDICSLSSCDLISTVALSTCRILVGDWCINIVCVELVSSVGHFYNEATWLVDWRSTTRAQQRQLLGLYSVAVLRFAVFWGSGVAIFSAGGHRTILSQCWQIRIWGEGGSSGGLWTYATFELFEHDI